jgi:hemerythrin-like domain-containing protein
LRASARGAQVPRVRARRRPKIQATLAFSRLARCLLKYLGMKHIADKPSEREGTGDLRRMLSADHERLERLFIELIAAFEADAREDVACLWSEFDVGLRTHLQLEEQHIFPEFGKAHAAEVAALLRDHELIRAQLLELGVGVDLHITNDERVERFIDRLRAHAAREDALMYQWAAHQLPPEADSPIRGWLQKVLAGRPRRHAHSAATSADNTGDRA